MFEIFGYLFVLRLSFLLLVMALFLVCFKLVLEGLLNLPVSIDYSLLFHGLSDSDLLHHLLSLAYGSGSHDDVISNLRDGRRDRNLTFENLSLGLLNLLVCF